MGFPRVRVREDMEVEAVPALNSICPARTSSISRSSTYSMSTTSVHVVRGWRVPPSRDGRSCSTRRDSPFQTRGRSGAARPAMSRYIEDSCRNSRLPTQRMSTAPHGYHIHRGATCMPWANETFVTVVFRVMTKRTREGRESASSPNQQVCSLAPDPWRDDVDERLEWLVAFWRKPQLDETNDGQPPSAIPPSSLPHLSSTIDSRTRLTRRRYRRKRQN